MEETHIPIIPNINTTQSKKQRRNIFDGEKDSNIADVPYIPRKKIDILDLETQKTNEELSSKKEDNGLSWVIIALVIVVIILLIAITYYILAKNSDKATPIPLDVLKPNPIHNQMSQMAQQMQHPPMQHSPMQHPPMQHSPMQHPPMQHPHVQHPPMQQDEVDINKPITSRPKIYVEPTGDELDDVLERVQNMKNEENPIDDKETTYINQNIENLIYDEDFSDDNGNINYVDPNEINEFHNQAISDEN
jgi:hypothetical protein